MPFRRYGGSFSEKGDRANQKIAVIGIYLLLACCLIALISRIPGFIILGFILFSVFIFLSMLSKGGVTEEVAEERRISHLKQAQQHFENGEYDLSQESFKTAKMYGDIPAEYLDTYKQAKYKGNDA